MRQDHVTVTRSACRRSRVTLPRVKFGEIPYRRLSEQRRVRCLTNSDAGACLTPRRTARPLLGCRTVRLRDDETDDFGGLV
jgi:hypothetical protein